MKLNFKNFLNLNLVTKQKIKDRFYRKKIFTFYSQNKNYHKLQNIKIFSFKRNNF
jgi:hypothetical protein